MRNLIIAWAAVLAIFIGGATWLQLSYQAENFAPLPTDTTNTPATDQTHSQTSPAEDAHDQAAAADSPQDTASTPPSDDTTVADDSEPVDENAAEQAAAEQTSKSAPLATAPADNTTQDTSIADPIVALSENGPYGPLPIVKNHQQPWRAYARPFGGTKRPKVAILLVGVGLDAALTKRTIDELPGAVSLGFSAYANDATTQSTTARKAGHELFVMTPMEPNDYPINDPGPHTLLVELTAAENLDRLYFLLSRFQAYAGIVNDMGSKFTANDFAITPILQDLQARGLMFIDARTNRFSVAGNTARDLGMPQVSNNRFLDNIITKTAIDQQLNDLVSAARTSGRALGIARPYPVTIDAIRQWARTLDAQGIDLVPVTAIAEIGTRKE